MIEHEGQNIWLDRGNADLGCKESPEMFRGAGLLQEEIRIFESVRNGKRNHKRRLQNNTNHNQIYLIYASCHYCYILYLSGLLFIL